MTQLIISNKVYDVLGWAGAGSTFLLSPSNDHKVGMIYNGTMVGDSAPLQTFYKFGSWYDLPANVTELLPTQNLTTSPEVSNTDKIGRSAVTGKVTRVGVLKSFPGHKPRILKEQHTGAMIAFDMSDDPFGKIAGPNAHVTLIYIGEADDIQDSLDGLRDKLHQFSIDHAPISGTFGGTAVFPANAENDDKAPIVRLYDSAALPAFRQALLHAIANVIPSVLEQTHGFMAHMTMIYTDKPEVTLPITDKTYSKTFNKITLYVGGEKTDYTLVGNMVEKQLIGRLKSFPGHAGIPGHQGGSLPSGDIETKPPKLPPEFVGSVTQGKAQERLRERAKIMEDTYGVKFAIVATNPMGVKEGKKLGVPGMGLPRAIYEKVEPIDDPTKIALVEEAFDKYAKPTMGLSYTTIKFATGLPFKEVFGVIEHLYQTDPHSVHYSVDRSGKNTICKVVRPPRILKEKHTGVFESSKKLVSKLKPMPKP